MKSRTDIAVKTLIFSVFKIFKCFLGFLQVPAFVYRALYAPVVNFWLDMESGEYPLSYLTLILSYPYLILKNVRIETYVKKTNLMYEIEFIWSNVYKIVKNVL